MEKIIRAITHKIFKFFWGLILLVLFVLIYNAGIYFLHEVQEWVYDVGCPLNNKHNFDSYSVDGSMYFQADWCEQWWWHPFRALNRIFTAICSATILIAIMPKKWLRSSYLGLWVVVFVWIHILAINENILFHEWFQDACLHRNRDTTKELCELQLGSFGDVRFFYPLAFMLTFGCAQLRSVDFFKHGCKP